PPTDPRRALLCAGLLVVLCSATALAFASKRIAAEQAAFTAPSAQPCVPSTLNRSAVLPGTSLAVSPLPDSYDASPYTQISLLGAPPGALSAVSVSGSQTGRHGGHLKAYSQGDGASFVPAKPFRSGETVSVRGKLTVAGKAHVIAFHFVVAQPDNLPYAAPAHVASDPGEVQHFHSLPASQPPALAITARSPQATPGDLFSTPYSGPGQSGPMIFDETGNVVWFDPLPTGTEASNLQVQQLEGKPVLSWWQGYIPPQGFGDGEEVILNSAYQLIGRVHAGNGFKVDLHDFHITPQDTAVLTVFNPIHCDLSSVGGPHGGAVTDSIFQEVDLRTGLVRREWHSLDHVPLSDSYSSATTTSTEWPYDFFHVNSIDQLPTGRTLISARNTWTLYELDTLTGQVLLRVGGKHSDIKVASDAVTAFQHDATMLENGTISVFDNGGVPKVHPQSRGLLLSVNPQTKTAAVVAQYEHSAALSSGSQGNIQPLPGGDVFVGWGSEPYFSEFSASGQVLLDGHMHGSYQSYRTYRFPWTGTPISTPAIAAAAAHVGGPPTVFASWNGATLVASWRVLAGPSSHQLAPVDTAVRSGFETAIGTPGPEAYVAVQALNAAGAVLGTSHTIKG
ncbi:MAG TPA: arylsulfotransferase family protein, partial [Solirubrobacteraceae bacterium]|nr:arylsulfotransferase family protein [Solirubrobacteraceae bacterium]